MNILFISNDPKLFEEGSAVRLRMRAYAQEVARTGGVLHVISRGRQSIQITEGPLVLHAFSGIRFLALHAMYHAARKLTRELPVAVVSAQDPFEHGWIAAQVVHGTRAKLHLQLHTDLYSPWFVRSGMARAPRVPASPLNRFRRFIANRTLPHADGIRVVSTRIKDSLIARYGDAIAVPSVLPIHVDMHPQSKVPFPDAPFPFTLISVSRLEPEKRIEDILYALAGLIGQYPVLGLAIVGEGSERRRLESLVSKLKIAAHVRFLGARADARGLMQSAQAFIQASAYEGYGITLIEAALARVPIITTDVGIVGEVFKGEAEVLAAPPADPTQLLYLIRRMLEDPSLRFELSMRAEAAARAHLASTHSEPSDIIADILRLAI